MPRASRNVKTGLSKTLHVDVVLTSTRMPMDGSLGVFLLAVSTVQHLPLYGIFHPFFLAPIQLARSTRIPISGRENLPVPTEV